MAGELIRLAVDAIVAQLDAELTDATVKLFSGQDPNPREVFPRSWWPRTAGPSRQFLGVVLKGFTSERLEKGSAARKAEWRVELNLLVHAADDADRTHALIALTVGTMRALGALEDSVDYGGTQWTLEWDDGTAIVDERGRAPFAGQVIVVKVATGPEP